MWLSSHKNTKKFFLQLVQSWPLHFLPVLGSSYYSPILVSVSASWIWSAYNMYNFLFSMILPRLSSTTNSDLENYPQLPLRNTLAYKNVQIMLLNWSIVHSPCCTNLCYMELLGLKDTDLHSTFVLQFCWYHLLSGRPEPP